MTRIEKVLYGLALAFVGAGSFTLIIAVILTKGGALVWHW
jgi:hypothetical protein